MPAHRATRETAQTDLPAGIAVRHRHGLGMSRVEPAFFRVAPTLSGHDRRMDLQFPRLALAAAPNVTDVAAVKTTEPLCPASQVPPRRVHVGRALRIVAVRLIFHVLRLDDGRRASKLTHGTQPGALFIHLAQRRNARTSKHD